MSKPLYWAYPPFDELSDPPEYISKQLVKCKFWKEKQEDAKRFYCLHNQPVLLFEVIVSLCSGDFYGSNEIESKLKEIKKAIDDIYPMGYCKEFSSTKYHDIIFNIARKLDPCLRCFKHKKENKYILYHLPKHGEIDFELLPDSLKSTEKNLGYIGKDDVLELNQEIKKLTETHKAQPIILGVSLFVDVLKWLKENMIIDNGSLRKSKLLLEEVCGAVFTGKAKPTIPHRVLLIKFLLKNHIYINYDDACEILFPNKDLKKKLEAARVNNQILIYQQSTDKKQCIFEITSLLKWLIIKKQLCSELESHFPKLKEEAIKQSIHECPELLTLFQLKDYLKTHSPDSPDAKWHVDHGIYAAYIKTDYIRLPFYSHRTPLKRTSTYTYTKRYKGIERLKSSNNDQFQTFNKLLTHKTIETSKQCIEVDSTSDESAIGLFRYISLDGGLNQENLVFIKDEVNAGLKKLQDKTISELNKAKGKKSGEARKKEAKRYWSEFSQKLLDVIKNYHGKNNANALSRWAVTQEMILPTEQSNIAKQIRNDHRFKRFHKI
ncbi:MAG: hypothetical protein ACHQAX_09635 [Gammaproteobacteria bacterium]